MHFYRALLPTRSIMAFRDKLKIEDDANLSAEDKRRRIVGIEAKLVGLDRQIAAAR
jgi:hypothetical protein